MKNTLQILLIPVLLVAVGCSTSKPIQQHYTFEDKQVFDLVNNLKKNPKDAESARLLPEAYEQALNTRQALTEAKYFDLVGGDRYMALARDWTVIQQMYEAIVSTPAAHKAIPSPMNASAQIQKQYSLAASEYYNEGMTYLNNNTRQYAQMAYDAFDKANKAVPGYKDVAQMMLTAKDKALIRVIVKPVNYNNYRYSYWGYQNDFFQDQMVRDLNFRSYRDVKFYTDWQASSQNIYPDKIVEMNYTTIYIGQVFNRSYTYKRSAEIQTGSTKSNPPKPIYTTVNATVYVNERYMQSNAVLQCRIYNVNGNNNIMYDNFPANYNWTYATARYTGDTRALTPQDWQMISNNNMNIPGRNQIATRLLQDCYSLLISRINSNVRFSGD